ncbi:MAG: DegT/DnrJ/EryC1/StrS family aminotransferase [Bryobacteraceae bacterium]|nr:DegT/DnrJ/EryC1/StrS family aminotransferase [Bryobacteraceae bacterium]
MLLVNDLSRQTALLRPQINDAIRRVLDRGWYIHGPELEAFESAFAAYLGTQHCVGVANGTDSLELALRAIGIGRGSRVATVAIAGMYSTTAILACGATPVYVDILPDSTHMDLSQLPEADAIIATHLYGQMEPMPDVLAAAKGVPVIEDCAQAHGARLHGRAAGNWGKLGCFSFYPTKNLGALGDGGAVVTNHPDLAGRLRALRQYGWTGKYQAEIAGGRNSRLDEIQAAVLLAKLPHLDQWNTRRREICGRYDFIGRPSIKSDVVHLYVLRTRKRDQLRQTLRNKSIGAEIHYPIPDYRQPAAGTTDHPRLPETERHCAEVLTLPCFPEMTDQEVAETRRAVIESL